MDQGDCTNVSIEFRFLEDDDGVNSISMIDEPKLFFKFNVQRIQELWTAPPMSKLAAVEESTVLIRRFATKYFVIFSRERMVSCVQDMISSIEIIRPNCHEYLRKQIADRACYEAKYLSITNPKTLIITVDIKLFRSKILREGDDHEREEDDHERGDVFETCVICFDELFEGREVKMMPCSHMFHGDCIDQWLGESNKCPLCRFEIYQFD